VTGPVNDRYRRRFRSQVVRPSNARPDLLDQYVRSTIQELTAWLDGQAVAEDAEAFLRSVARRPSRRTRLGDPGE